LITGATGVGGGFLGYLGAKHQGDVELEKMAAENTRLERQLEEPHRQHRQGAYHDYLDVIARFQLSATFEFEGKGMLEFAERMEHTMNAVALFGSRRAYEAARRLTNVVEEAMGTWADYSGSEIEERFLAEYWATVDAMRPDTAPD